MNKLAVERTFSVEYVAKYTQPQARTHMHRLEDDVEKKTFYLIFSMDSHVFDPQICNSCFSTLG